MSIWQKLTRRHKAPATTKHSAPQAKSVNAARKQPQADNEIQHIIAIASGKGGVGKSTITHQLGQALQAQGKQVGILDADIYGPSQATLFNDCSMANVESGIIMPVINQGIKFIAINAISQQSEAMVVRSPIAIRAISQFLTGVQWGKLDYLLIDLPPGTGDIQLSIAQKTKLSGAIIVTTPQPLAAQIAAKSISMFNKVNVPIIGVIENMSGYHCQHCHQHNDIFAEGGGQDLADKANASLLGQIPLNASLVSNSHCPDSAIQNIFATVAEKTGQWLQTHIGDAQLEPKQTLLSKDRTQLTFIWPDDSKQVISAHQLRCLCACAACKDEFSGEPILNTELVPKNIKILQVKAIGRYGIGVRFSDGHKTGIYRYSSLADLAKT